MAGKKGRSGRKPGYKSDGWRLREAANLAAHWYKNRRRRWLEKEKRERLPPYKLHDLAIEAIWATACLIGEAAFELTPEIVIARAKQRPPRAHDELDAMRAALLHYENDKFWRPCIFVPRPR
jgi:hypothetical protein